MDNVPDIKNKINKMYDEAKYLDIYGGSYYGTILLFIVFFFVIGYLLVKINLIPLKKSFPQNKCNPAYIPFAGIIAAPPDQTAMEFTASNFSMCINQVLEMIVHNYTKPVTSIVNMLSAIFKSLMKAVAIIKKSVYRLKNILQNILNLIVSRILSAIMPFLKIIIKLKDSMAKLGAIMGSTLMMLIGLYLGVKAWIGTLLAQVIIFLVIIIAILMVIYFIPFVGPVIAGIGLIAWVIMATALGLIAGYITYILSLTKPAVPSKPVFPPPPKIWPFCFAPDTPVNMNDGTVKKMCNIETGDILENNNTVISTIQIKGDTQNPFYCIKSKKNDTEINVTGSHKIKDPKTGEFIFVKDFVDSHKTIFWAPKMFCLITESHEIPIAEFTFKDWED